MTPQKRNPQTIAAPHQIDAIDPRWLLKAIAWVVLAAFICGYLTLCLLFYQGQWQLILHPTRSTTPLTTFAGSPSQPVHFDAAETGSPRLSGALLPAPANARYSAYTVLYLRGGDGSLADDLSAGRNITLLHALGLNVFVFDYRGYGQSDPIHPNQVRMTEDAQAALRYLTGTRAISDAHIVLYGAGLGAGLAASLASTHPDIPALVLDSPGPTPISIVRADPRTRLLPVRVLFHEDFSLAALAGLHTPKLLISYPTPLTPVPEAFTDAAEPKTTLELAHTDTVNHSAGISRFLDQTVPHVVPQLKE